MPKTISAAQAKANLSSLMAEVAHGKERVLIERRGKPLAALVSVDDLRDLEEGKPAAEARGALALVGLWKDVNEEEFDALVADIYASREEDTGQTEIQKTVQKLSVDEERIED